MGFLFNKAIKAAPHVQACAGCAGLPGWWGDHSVGEKRQHRVTVESVDDLSLRDAVNWFCPVLYLDSRHFRSGATIIGELVFWPVRAARRRFSFFLAIPRCRRLRSTACGKCVMPGFSDVGISGSVSGINGPTPFLPCAR